MIIKPNMTIREFQGKFHEKFQGLRIEFYSNAHAKNQASAAETRISADTTIGDLSDKMGDGIDITFNLEDSVNSVEQHFEKAYGLHIQIFRRSNRLWLQTSATDEWSLDKQNTKGLHSIQPEN